MEGEEHALFRKGQKIHVAVYVASDSVNGGYLRSREVHIESVVWKKMKQEDWVEIIPERLCKQG